MHAATAHKYAPLTNGKNMGKSMAAVAHLHLRYIFSRPWFSFPEVTYSNTTILPFNTINTIHSSFTDPPSAPLGAGEVST